MSTRTRCPVCGRDLPTGPNHTRGGCPHCGPAESGAPTSGTDPDATRSAPGESVGLTARSAVLDPAESPDELGRLGPYRLLAELGRGGMGVVYRAEDTHLRRAVAIKMMLPEAAASPAASERFLREARAAAAVESDHVVPIFHVGEHAGVPFLVMPLLSGEPLDARLRRERVLEPAEAARVGREIAEGLAAAHARGLVHRDIKPANVWLEGDRRRAKLLDFGLALSAGGGDQRLTRTGGVVGTASYMAPEQATGKDVDHRADLFSLGCVLYRMTVGREPFKGRDFISILVAITSEEPVPADRENPALRGAFAALIGELLAKDPARRPPSARAVADRLAAIEAQADPTAADAPSAGTPARRPSRGPLVAVLVAGVLAAAGVGVWFATRDHGERPQPEPDVVKQQGISEDGAGKKIDGSKQSGGDDTKKVVETKVVGVAFHSLPVIAARPVEWDRRGTDPAGFTLSLVGVVGEGRLRHWSPVTAVAFSPDGRVFATPHTKPRAVQLWTTADWQPLTELPCKDPPQAVAFVHDDTLLVGHSDGSVARWGIDAKASRTVREPDFRALRWLVAGPGGRFSVGSVGSDDPQLWDPAREALQSLAEPRQAEGVTFHPDGKRLVVPTADGTVGLGDGKSATLLPVGPRRGVVKQALVTHDRRHLVTVNGNGTAYIVRLEGKAP